MWNLCENFGDIKVIIRIRKSTKNRQHNGQKKKNRRTDNTMDKRKRTEGQTTQWPKEKEQNDRQHNGQKKKNKMTD